MRGVTLGLQSERVLAERVPVEIPDGLPGKREGELAVGLKPGKPQCQLLLVGAERHDGLNAAWGAAEADSTQASVHR
ncbi:MAG: hypothetical protein ACREP9_09815, partial [Candidatus Dormibacteraceae bacterium]